MWSRISADHSLCIVQTMALGEHNSLDPAKTILAVQRTLDQYVS